MVLSHIYLYIMIQVVMCEILRTKQNLIFCHQIEPSGFPANQTNRRRLTASNVSAMALTTKIHRMRNSKTDQNFTGQ